jgi:hypothetical protein
MATRNARPGIGCSIFLILLGAFAVFALVEEMAFGSRAPSCTARVKYFVPTRSGLGQAGVEYEVDGEPVEATLQTSWFYTVKEGDQVSILYLPENPRHVRLESTWQRYLWPVFLLLVLGPAAAAGIVSLLSGLRKAKGKSDPSTQDKGEPSPETGIRGPASAAAGPGTTDQSADDAVNAEINRLKERIAELQRVKREQEA